MATSEGLYNSSHSFAGRLHDFHPDGQEDVLIDTMKMLKWTGDPWEDVFSEEVRFFRNFEPGCVTSVSVSPLVLPEDGSREYP